MSPTKNTIIQQRGCDFPDYMTICYHVTGPDLWHMATKPAQFAV